MSTFNLGLPTDIPWKRLCYTEDMTHAPICGHQPPPKWRSSVAIFEYEPDVEYQLLQSKGYTVSYLKVAVTITPDAVDIPIDYTKQFIPNVQPSRYQKVGQNQRALLSGKFPLSSPCYGAMLQVSVGPKTSGTEKDIYFADFEPKKRELYETVTQTGELTSGSSSRLSIGKSAMTTHATENSSSYGAGISANVGISEGTGIGITGKGEWTNHESNGSQQSDITTTDRSTERRESQSHSTYLAQMYNLFQSFHVGTNRAMFFMEPRPHVVMTEATFINGPRALEGIQEVFLVVVRKSTMPDYCVNVILETAHLENVPADLSGVGSERVEVVEGRMVCKVPEWARNTPDRHGPSFDTYSYRPPDGWEIDVALTKEELPVVSDNHCYDADIMGECKILSLTSAELKLSGKGVWHTYVGESGIGIDDAYFSFSMIVHLKVKPVSVASTFYLTARNLCCCTQTPTVHPDHFDPHVIYEKGFTGGPWTKPVTSGPSTTDTLRDSNEFTTVLRSEMIASMNSAYRFADGPVPLGRSNVFFTRVATVLKENDAADELDRAIGESTVLPENLRRQLSDAFGDVTVGRVVVMNPTDMAGALGKTVNEVLEIKEGILRAIADAAAPAPAVPYPSVAGVRIASSYPDPNNVRTLATMEHPADLLLVDTADRPNIIEVRFSEPPDLTSVTTTSFAATRNGAPIAAQILPVGASTVRLVLLDPLAAGDLIGVKLLGNGPQAITFKGRRLDGDPSALPSGDGVEGGNFTFALKVRTAVPGRPTVSAVLAKVTGVEIASTFPDPTHPTVLARMTAPTDVQRVPLADLPNVIDVTFSVAPDVGTVTAASFTVTRDGALLPAQVAMLTPTTARLVLDDPMAQSGHYAVRINGATNPAVTSQGYRLDGEGLALPSGNDVPGGDFTFVVEAMAAAAVPPAPPVPTALLKAAGIRVRSTAANPASPTLLAEMIHPAVPLQFAAAAAPDTIDVDFNLPPDAGTVTATSFLLFDGSTPVAAVVTALSTVTFRLTASAALTAGKTYTVRLKGVGLTAITLAASPLDGEPLRLPSGDGAPGTDFTFSFTVV